jgi:hypothetical protein
MLPTSLAFATAIEGEETTNVTVEYRYSTGDPLPTIPATLNRFNQDYRLISQSAPVLESSLPQTRTYTYRVDGLLSPEDIAQVASLGIVLTPVEVATEREVDKIEVIEIENNDVDSLPTEKAFVVTSATDPSGSATVMLQRAAVSYTVLLEDDGLPELYEATVTYRGIETYLSLGYYTATATFESIENLDDLEVFVITAIYEPILPPAPPAEPTPAEPVPEAPTTNSEFSDADQALVDSQTGNPLVDIVSGNTPLGGPGIYGAWSFLSLLLSVIAVLSTIILLLSGLAGNRRQSEADLDSGQVFSQTKRYLPLKVLASAAGLLTPIIWLVMDNLTQPLVWVNAWTVFVAGMFVAHVIVLAAYVFMKHKVIDTSDFDQPGFLQA